MIASQSFYNTHVVLKFRKGRVVHVFIPPHGDYQPNALLQVFFHATMYNVQRTTPVIFEAAGVRGGYRSRKELDGVTRNTSKRVNKRQARTDAAGQNASS